MDSREVRLGIDFGGVIIPHDRQRFIECEPEDVVNLEPLPLALETVAALVGRLDAQVWIISKAGAGTRDRTRRWFHHYDFHGRTKIPEARVMYCDAHEDKRGICSELKITDMIDDRRQVHKALDGVVQRRYLFGNYHDAGAPFEPKLIAVPDWAAVADLLLREGAE